MWKELGILVLWAPFLVKSSPVEFVRKAALESSLSVLIIRNQYCPGTWMKEFFDIAFLSVIVQSASDVNPRNPEVSRPLHLVCLPETAQDFEILHNLAGSLQDYPHDKVILYGTNISNSRSRIETLLKSCHDLSIHNVVGLLAADEAKYFYTYHRYPRFWVEQCPSDRSPVFQQSFPNMQGNSLIVMPDQWLPRSILYVDRDTGNQMLAGSVGRFLKVLAWKLNATLQLAKTTTPGRFLRSCALQELGELMRFDVSASLSMLEYQEQLHRTSYPLELTHICLMIPVAQTIPLQKIYRLLGCTFNILIALAVIYAYGLLLCLLRRLNDENVYMVDFMLDDRALRGILGQSFRLPFPHSSRWIYLVLGIVGLNVSSIFEAALETMMAHPPREFQARSFADLRRTQLPLVTTEEDLHTVIDLQLNLLVLNVSEYHLVRSSGNSSSAYFASRLHWTLFSEEQKRFNQELFIYSMDACLWSLALLSFQWPKSSWLTDAVSKLILEVRANGLYQFWVGMHYYDMTKAGLAGMQDPNVEERESKGIALQLVDLQWIWLTYGVLVTASVIVFLMEVSWIRKGS
ncbi:hypothetical protein KR018_006544 [Drosophila ironensis]|nr:hypothetical protein KR018_006544 [Drosophila ironensis]